MVESCCLRASRSVFRDWSWSGVGAEVKDSLSEVSWFCSWPSSNWSELIVESFSESDVLRAATSFSLDEDKVE